MLFLPVLFQGLLSYEFVRDMKDKGPHVERDTGIVAGMSALDGGFGGGGGAGVVKVVV